MFLESEIRDLQKLLKEERSDNQLLSQKLQLTERQLAVERLYVSYFTSTVISDVVKTRITMTKTPGFRTKTKT